MMNTDLQDVKRDGMRFRDRDAPITHDGLIFRAYGYDHPEDACFCDLEYAPETQYTTDDPRAHRDGLPTKHYKFYFDGGIRFALSHSPAHALHHRPLNRMMAGVTIDQISRVIHPQERLQELLRAEGDPLVEATREVLDRITQSSALSIGDFGVFGSLAHGFHNPRHSDIDLIIYGARQLRELRSTLGDLYEQGSMANEYEGWTTSDPPTHWNFKRYTKEEYGASQRRKLIYVTTESEPLGRRVKIEFEPVRRWDEVRNEYPNTERIENLGRVEAVGVILSGDEAGFMPSIYPVEIEETSARTPPEEIRRVVSYVEEYRLQLQEGETALIRGNLEKVTTSDGEFHQITLSYGPDYFDQVLKPRADSS
jgi:predicted nucleotidyltransferase